MLALHAGHLVSQFSLQSGHLISVTLVLLADLLDVSLLVGTCLALKALNLSLELFDLVEQTGLILLLHLCVLLDLLADLRDLDLELLSDRLTILEQLLVLSYVSLQIVEHLQFLIEGDQGVQFVLKLDFLLLECELQLVLLSLVKQSIGKPSLSNRSRHSCLGDFLGARCWPLW